MHFQTLRCTDTLFCVDCPANLRDRESSSLSSVRRRSRSLVVSFLFSFCLFSPLFLSVGFESLLSRFLLLSPLHFLRWDFGRRQLRSSRARGFFVSGLPLFFVLCLAKPSRVLLCSFDSSCLFLFSASSSAPIPLLCECPACLLFLVPSLQRHASKWYRAWESEVATDLRS